MQAGARNSRDSFCALTTFDAFRGLRPHRLANVITGYTVKAMQWPPLARIPTEANLRCACKLGYLDHPEKHNPASQLKCFRLVKKDWSVPDPFTIYEAEAVIAAIHGNRAEAQGDYDEFRFFTGLCRSEQIALRVDDFDLSQGKIMVNNARLMKRDNNLSRAHSKCSSVSSLCERTSNCRAGLITRISSSATTATRSGIWTIPAIAGAGRFASR